MKPLFIPLKTEFFEAFENGTKDTEYRMHGPRWNERTCAVGRAVTLSHGYGKKRRLKGVIVGFHAGFDPTLTEAWKTCYGDKPRRAACIKIKLISA